MSDSPQPPHVVVVGGGFAGLAAVRKLARAPVRVTLLDRHNYHLFQPLLYQVATAALSPADVAYPIRRIVRNQRNCEVRLAEVEAIRPGERVVELADGELRYDWLILASGATHSYFGKDDWAEAAPGLKTIDDALEIRRRLLLAFEEAELETDDAERRAKLTFVVVGGGPTGVELAGALMEIAAKAIPRDFRNIDTTTTRVILVEGEDRLLGAMPPVLSEKARQSLENMGVEVRLGSRVTDIDDEGVVIGDERIPAANVLWAAGVKASPLAESLGVELDKAGRVIVGPNLRVPGHPEIFVVGDLAHLKDERTGELVPGVAPAAMQMGAYAGETIRREVTAGARDRQGERPPFRYLDKGTMATIGRARAVADIKGLRFGGVFAWLLWSLVHLLFLISFRNKVFVMLSWIWTYVLFSKGARLITGDDGR